MGNTSENYELFESNPLPAASYLCTVEITPMKSAYQVAFASLVLILATLAPASAVAQNSPNAGHSHDLTYHDRTPHVHEHMSHSHHR